MQHREIVVLRERQDVFQRQVVRRRVDQLAVLDKCCRLREPCRIPERAHLAFRLVARTRAAVETVEGRALKKKSSQHLQFLTSGPGRRPASSGSACRASKWTCRRTSPERPRKIAYRAPAAARAIQRGNPWRAVPAGTAASATQAPPRKRRRPAPRNSVR